MKSKYKIKNALICGKMNEHLSLGTVVQHNFNLPPWLSFMNVTATQ